MRSRSINMRARAVVVLALIALAAGPAVFAAEPGTEIFIDQFAPNAGLGVYQVPAGDEVAFVEALIQNSGYLGSQPGFSNERIIRSQAASERAGTITFLVVTRHYNKAAMQRLQQQREAAVRPLLSAPATFVSLDLVEHQVPDWGWERNQAVQFTRVGPTEGERVLNEYGTSLSFFKYGYTGQIAVVEVHAGDRGLSGVRSALTERAGLAGASIFRDASGAFVVYGEFFATPESLRDGQLRLAANQVTGAQIGTVVQNFRER